MDELIKRFVITYLGLTASFWAISYGMTVNGSARPWNPAWHLVSNIRAFFSWGLVLAVGAFIFFRIMEGISTMKKEEELAAKNRMEAERRARLDAQRQYEKAMIEAEQIKQKQREEMEAKKCYEERKRKKVIEKRTRSAEDAADKALADF